MTKNYSIPKKPKRHFYVDIKMPYLHEKISEFGAKTVRIKMSWAVITNSARIIVIFHGWSDAYSEPGSVSMLNR